MVGKKLIFKNIIAAFALLAGFSGILSQTNVYAQPAGPVAVSLLPNGALMSDGTVKSWGMNGDIVPKTISGLSGSTQVFLSNQLCIALMEDGTVKTWFGSEDYGMNCGQLGFGDYSPVYTPTTVPSLNGVVWVASGMGYAFAVLADGTVLGWGGHYNGSLGLGSDFMGNILTPTVIPGLTNVARVYIENGCSFAILKDGTVMGWGDNRYGNLGIADLNIQYSPVIISSLTGVRSISGGDFFTVALMNDNTVKSWGVNASGELGLGDRDTRLVPTTISGLSGVSSICAGGSHVLAALSNGQVAVWGDDQYGQLGVQDHSLIRGSTIMPTIVPQISGITDVAGGLGYSLLLTSDGTILSCGQNDRGQLGNGLLDEVDVFTPVNAMPTIHINDNTFGTGLNQVDYHGIAWSYSSSEPFAFNGDLSTSTFASDYCTLRFKGSQARIFGKICPDAGKAAVSIDNGPETAVDLYSPVELEQSIIFTSQYLNYGEHTMQVRVTGAKNAASSGTKVGIDRIDVVKGPTIVNDRTVGTCQYQFDYHGRWVAGADNGNYNNDKTMSSTANDYATISFYGTKVKLFSKTWNNRGIAAISIDNGAETMVDLYSACAVFQALVYTSPNLAPCNHTMKIRVTCSKSPFSSGYNLPIDKVEILTDLAPTIVTRAWTENFNLHVRAKDDFGEEYLTYTWETVEPAPSPVNLMFNGKNRSKDINIYNAFMKCGTYNFRVIVRDENGQTATSGNCIIQINPVPTYLLIINPYPAYVVKYNEKVQFSALCQDQFSDIFTCTDFSSAVKETEIGKMDANGMFTAKNVTGDFQTLIHYREGQEAIIYIHVGPVTEEAEDLLIASSDCGASVYYDANFSNNRQVTLIANGVNSWVEFNLYVETSGNYLIKVYSQVKPNRGKFQVSVDGVNLSSVQDQYASTMSYQKVFTLGTRTLTRGAPNALRMTVVGKNSSSTGYWISCDKIELIKQ